MLISVIIPIYNGEAYLKDCLDSVEGQTWRSLEVLMVDDGSGDESGGICAVYAERDPRFRLLSQRHGGLSRARNTGLEAAKGDYVFFLDADDVLPEDSLELLGRLAKLEEGGKCETAQAGGAFDLIVGNHYRFASDQSAEIPFHYEDQLVEAGQSTGAQRYEWFFGTGIMASAWGKLFRRQFLKDQDLWFTDNSRIYEEDRMFLYRCMACGPSIRLTGEVVYGYRRSPDSISASYKEDYPRRMTCFFSECSLYFKEKGVYDQLYDLLAVHVPFSLYLCCLNAGLNASCVSEGESDACNCGDDPVRLYQECGAVTELAREFGAKWNKEDCGDRVSRIFLKTAMRLLSRRRGKPAARCLLRWMMAAAGTFRGEKSKGRSLKNG